MIFTKSEVGSHINPTSNFLMHNIINGDGVLFWYLLVVIGIGETVYGYNKNSEWCSPQCGQTSRRLLQSGNTGDVYTEIH